jgi:hypothetical protein
MSSAATAVIIVVAIIVIALIFALRRRRRLQQRFGPEYDRAVAEKDSRMQAEAELSERQRRVRKYNIQPLSPEARSRYLGEWQAIQEQFVDAPQAAVSEAYSLVTTVMQERGYPSVEDEQAAEDLSVEHPSTVGHFRSAQAITREAAHGSVATEDLRQAFIHYRELFAELLGDAGDAAPASAAAGRHAAAEHTDFATEDTNVAAEHTDVATEDTNVAAEDTDVAAEDTDVAADQAPLPTADADGEPVTSAYMEPDGSRRS